MSQQIIKFRIRQDGIVEELVEGVHGSSCEQVTQSIEEKLGDITRRELKPEYYENKETVNVEQPLTKWR